MSDLRAVAARKAHLEAEGADRAAAAQRDKRDRLVRQLRAEDPERWSLGALAAAVGCSRALIQRILGAPPQQR